MKMTTRVAYCNMRHYKSKNILIGIAIILTTLLLFVIPSIGKDMVEVNFAVINKIYPTWHALYRNVDESTVMKLAAHHDVKTYGLRSDAGYMNLEDATVSMMYMDRTGMELYKVKLKEGQLPQKENDIVVSKGILEALGQNGKIGDTITVPYQILKDDGLDYTKEKDFRICGFLADNESSKEQKQYTSLVSEAFLKAEIPVEQVKYRFLLQVNGQKGNTTADYTETIQNIARQFGISEDDMNINKEYLAANYVDPATIPVIVGIMLIVVLAGIITIYSVYYVSMNQRVREFGKLKAIGATKRQLRQIVLREGMGVALFAIPIGLLIGTVAVKVVLLQFVEHAKDSNVLITEAYKVVAKGEVQLYYWWIYLLAIAVTLCTVYLSLMKPMRMAAKVSEIEAMRYQGGSKRQKSSRKGYQFLNIGRLTKRNLAENKKKSTITIVSMAVTGIFVMMVATVLSCANPMESAKSSIVGQYEISPIMEILESEGNQQREDDKFNRVDIKARNSKDEIILVEVQNTRELYYLERILYGVAKAITEHIDLGGIYANVKKVYSISILYFDIGQGNDYLYHGQNTFLGVHTGDCLKVTTKEQGAIIRKLPAEIFPEYFLIRVNEFNKVAVTPLEEWIEYLKTGTIRPDTTTPGLEEARQKLIYYNMNKADKLAYDRHLDALMIQNDVLSTAKLEGLEEGRVEGREEGIMVGR